MGHASPNHRHHEQNAKREATGTTVTTECSEKKKKANTSCSSRNHELQGTYLENKDAILVFSLRWVLPTVVAEVINRQRKSFASPSSSHSYIQASSHFPLLGKRPTRIRSPKLCPQMMMRGHKIHNRNTNQPTTATPANNTKARCVKSLPSVPSTALLSP